MLTTEYIRPKIGVPHFKSTVKQIRAENNTRLTAHCDIIDNVCGIASVNNVCYDCRFNIDYNSKKKIIRFKYSDNIEHGFKNIYENGINNPLNMGHIRDGHNDDKETSEFGIGLKKAMIYLSDNAVIVTKIVKKNKETGEDVEIYEKGVCVFRDMINISNDNPEKSYEPTDLRPISRDVYKEYHPYDEGSTIILEEILNEDTIIDHDNVGDNQNLSPEEFTDNLINEFKKVYSNLIRNKVFNLYVNNVKIDPDIDIVKQIHNSNKIVYSFWYLFDINNQPVEIYSKRSSQKNTYRKYDFEEKKLVQATKEDCKNFKKAHAGSLIKLKFISLTTAETEYNELKNFNYTELYRNGRNYGKQKLITDSNDGYSNRIYNRIEYDSKKINSHIGIGSNKRWCFKKDNIIGLILCQVNKEARNILSKIKNTRIEPAKPQQVIIKPTFTVTKPISTRMTNPPNSSSIKKKRVKLVLDDEGNEETKDENETNAQQPYLHADLKNIIIFPNFPDDPDCPNVPDGPDVPNVPDGPNVPDVPDVPNVPNVPDVPDGPNVPDVPNGPEDKPVSVFNKTEEVMTNEEISYMLQILSHYSTINPNYELVKKARGMLENILGIKIEDLRK